MKFQYHYLFNKAKSQLTGMGNADFTTNFISTRWETEKNTIQLKTNRFCGKQWQKILRIDQQGADGDDSYELVRQKAVIGRLLNDAGDWIEAMLGGDFIVSAFAPVGKKI